MPRQTKVIQDRAGLAECLAEGRYPGGKGADGTANWIMRHFPPHEVYVEPFAGSGAIARRKRPAPRTLLIELDPITIEWWETIGAETVPGATIIHGDGLEWWEKNCDRLPPSALVYLDPPYLLKVGATDLYNYRFPLKSHQRMLLAAKRASCYVALSGYRSQLYDRELGVPGHTAARGGDGREVSVPLMRSCGPSPDRATTHWWRSSRRVQVRWSRQLALENLWTNFDPREHAPIVWESAGLNYRDNERIDKKARRWRENFLRLPEGERGHILSRMLAPHEKPTRRSRGTIKGTRR